MRSIKGMTTASRISSQLPARIPSRQAVRESAHCAANAVEFRLCLNSDLICRRRIRSCPTSTRSRIAWRTTFMSSGRHSCVTCYAKQWHISLLYRLVRQLGRTECSRCFTSLAKYYVFCCFSGSCSENYSFRTTLFIFQKITYP